MKACERGLTCCRAWRTSSHRAREIRTSSAQGMIRSEWRLKAAELDWENSQLQECEGTRGSNASQSNGCCFDSAILEHFKAIIQGELDRVFDVQHQPSPATPAHQGPGGQQGKELSLEEGAGDWDKEQRKRAHREY